MLASFKLISSGKEESWTGGSAQADFRSMLRRRQQASPGVNAIKMFFLRH